MKNNTNQTFSTLQQSLSAWGYDGESITADSSFIKDLGFDSLDFAEFVMKMEHEFDIRLPYDLVEQKGRNVEGFIGLIEEQLNKKNSNSGL